MRGAILLFGAGTLLSCQSVISAQPREGSLCELLAGIKAGETRNVEVSGIYTFGFEDQVLYDSNEPRCRANVQPATWVEFAPGVDVRALGHAVGTADRAFVTFRGTLYGPRPPQADSPKIPAEIASGIRVNNRGYGHLNAFRTKLVVDAVDDAKAVPASLPRSFEWSSPPAELIPRVVEAAMPGYPHFAQFGGIEGVVEARITVTDGKVSDVQVLNGERILATDTVKNIKTWRFPEHVSASFIARFVYELERREAGANRNPRIEAQLPTFVRVIGVSNDW